MEGQRGAGALERVARWVAKRTQIIPRHRNVHALLTIGLERKAAFRMLALRSYNPPSRPWRGPSGRSADLRAALRNGAQVRVRSFSTGDQSTTMGKLLDRRDPKSRAVAGTPFTSRVLVHLVEHPDHGCWLIDAGLDTSFQRSGTGSIRGLLKSVAVKPFRQAPGQDVASLIARENVRPAGIFFTHLHIDHTSGTRLLDPTIRFVAGPVERPISFGPLFFERHLSTVPVLERVGFDGARSAPGSLPAVDLFGDASFWALSTPGHTPGHLSFLAATAAGPVLLLGDVSHTRWGWEHEVAPGFSADPAGALATLRRARELAASLEVADVRFGHDLAA